MPFGECIIKLQDLGLSIDGEYVSGCLMDFERYIKGGRPAWTRFEELLGVLPPADCIDKFTVKRGYSEEVCEDLHHDVIIDSTPWGQVWYTYSHPVASSLPYITRLEDMGRYSWRSVVLAWFYRCMCRVANRNVVNSFSRGSSGIFRVSSLMGLMYFIGRWHFINVIVTPNLNRYKLERHRISNEYITTSHWPWFKHMENIFRTHLLRKNSSVATKTRPSSPLLRGTPLGSRKV
ncbi:hypothetical protein Ahy_A01g002044 [Arachis hypogaea]|uniref:Aminotransferase-like plant mobile domain-containing protein n=1 Tax=Arachis hypogaea TaxID=3818 RepID=A0A445EQ00_ARAHY|nr:hypothetical protein Ahy_A01g002044 [Arachis hypogaea]